MLLLAYIAYNTGNEHHAAAYLDWPTSVRAGTIRSSSCSDRTGRYPPTAAGRTS